MWWRSRSKTEVDHEDERSPESELDETYSPLGEVLDLQRAVGNQTVQRILGNSPAKSTSAESSSNTSISSGVRQEMEDRFGERFDDVRIHTDPDSAASAVERGNSAYTTGRDIYFAPGKYAPDTVAGAQLLSHELAHVVQQSKGAAGQQSESQSDPEQEADRAAHVISSGGRPGASLSPVTTAAPMGAPADWSKDVTDAKTKKDADAMAALVETAIATTKKKVVAAKTSPGGDVNPKEYSPLPVINFDINLNSKKSKPLSAGGATRSLGSNYGYWFSDGGNLYVVLGPNALNDASPLFTMMSFEHEMYHIAHHAPAATPTTAPATKAPATQPGSQPASKPATRTTDEEELETYTHDFLNYFHQLRSFGPQWSPLIEYYERSSATERATTLGLLKAYYKSPSPPAPAADVASVQKSFENWVRRRLKDSATATKQLILDLSKDLSITLSTSATTGTTAPTGSVAPPPGGP
jgi:hypothetical protein